MNCAGKCRTFISWIDFGISGNYCNVQSNIGRWLVLSSHVFVINGFNWNAGINIRCFYLPILPPLSCYILWYIHCEYSNIFRGQSVRSRICNVEEIEGCSLSGNRWYSMSCERNLSPTTIELGCQRYETQWLDLNGGWRSRGIEKRLHLRYATYTLHLLSTLQLCTGVISGKLTLKIPWKNLYTEPTVAQLDGLYVVVVPNTSMFTWSSPLLTAA